MPKVNNTWMGNQFQPQQQVYQTAGMLQPRTPTQPPAPPPTTPTTTPTTPATGGTGNVLNIPPVGPPAFATPPVVQQQTTPQLLQPTTGDNGRDRLVNSLLGLQFMEQ